MGAGFGWIDFSNEQRDRVFSVVELSANLKVFIPTATLFVPPEVLVKASLPIAILFDPPVIFLKAVKPMPILLSPVVKALKVRPPPPIPTFLTAAFKVPVVVCPINIL